ncbi:MAG: efflux RND transporter periplasmic adaptor subunit [Thiovulaceae bacterium]|nr:efflux RND transporter periplasmic adaptor subunit [Sulfurimonadaceae bacterium]
MKTWTKTLLIFALLLGAATLFYFKIYLPKISYKTASAKIGSLHVSVFGIGNVDARDIYPITAQTGGKISSILTDEGKWVKKGDLLATIDPVDLPSLLDEAKRSRQKAQFESVASKNELKTLQAQKEMIAITFKRYEKLYAQKYISKAEYDKADTDLKGINAQIAGNLAHNSANEIEIKKASSSLEGLQTKLSRLHIIAPVDGYVLSKDAQVAQNISPTQSIVTIVDPKTVWVKTFVDEKISSNIALGQNAKITLRSQLNREFDAKVVRISAISDATTQEREVAVAFVNLPIPFYIHEQAEVRIETGLLNNVTLLDESLLTYLNKESGVWIVKDSKAHFLKLTILAHSDKKVACKEKVTSQILVPDATKRPLVEGMRIHL